MRIVFTTLSFLFFSNLFSQVSDTIFNQRDAKGIKQGIWKNVWTGTGKTAAIINYKDEIKNGFCMYFWENGNLQSSGFFIDNSIEGEFRSYYQSGKLYEVKNYKNNQRNGWTIYYDTLGRVASEGLWKDGMAFGLYKEYKDGKLADSAFEKYDVSTKIFLRQVYHDSGMKNLRVEYFYSVEKNGGESPFMIRHYNNGVIFKEEKF